MGFNTKMKQEIEPMAKLTKRQMAEEKAKGALMQRVKDVYAGACGYVFEAEEEVFTTATELARIMPVLQAMFGTEANDHLWSLPNLGDFESPETATDVLFRNGVRA